MKGFHECEMKFYVDNNNAIDRFINTMHAHGYNEQKEKLETDYIFDTYDGDLKKEKILLRVRSLIISTDEEILFTVKTKGKSSAFQDSIEYETTSSNPDVAMIQAIIAILHEKTEILLTASVFNTNNVKDIIQAFASFGLIVVNVVQKKRKEYTGKKSKVLIDKFPKIQGFFVEIEADCEEKLFESIKNLNLDITLSDKRNYGQIIADMTNNEKILLFDN